MLKLIKRIKRWFIREPAVLDPSESYIRWSDIDRGMKP